MQATTGIPTVFGTFREALHRQRSGRGNPAKDLGILLDLYEQWQKQVFPHTDFDTFSKKVTGLYGKPGGKQTTGATLKVCTVLLSEGDRLRPTPIADVVFMPAARPSTTMQETQKLPRRCFTYW